MLRWVNFTCRTTPIQEEARKEEASRPTEERRPEEKRSTEEALKAFIAVSSSPMNWIDAGIFCDMEGGRLPRINGSDSWDGKGKAIIDGFGARGARWLPGVPAPAYFWTSTVHEKPETAYVVGSRDGESIFVGHTTQDKELGVLCVPDN